jgi:Integral peroxisomal membrane peroxin
MLILIWNQWKAHSSNSPPPVTEMTLQKTISDLEKISALVPAPYALPSLPIMIILRVSAMFYIPYLLLFYFVRLRILVALAGTLILTWRAPWALTVRQGLWRSAWIRWLAYKTWSLLSGEPLLQPIRQKDDKYVTESAPRPNAKSAIHGSSTSLRFEFTVHENQRWWMGLDWTAALLPQERPAWSSASEQPVSPPSVFTLPASTTVYTKNGNGRMKRVATWKWEEDEWRLLVKKQGVGASRVARPLPSLKEELPAGARLLKAAGMMKDTSITSEHRDEHHVNEEEEEDVCTDNDGWVYSDNKWEKRSSKGGMGKVGLVFNIRSVFFFADSLL